MRLILFFILLTFTGWTQETPVAPVSHVTFPAPDGVEISANLYEVDPNAPIIVLCHQARFNKFEYEGIAQRLNSMGFNCLAIDQRSGGPIASMQNETHLKAIEIDRPTEFLDAEIDIITAIDYAANKYNGKLILWGSSYSSTLVLYVALENDKVHAVVAFSPGNYFEHEKGSLIDGLTHLKKPAFITSSKSEAEGILQLTTNLSERDIQTVFTPDGPGHHGSRALWPNQTGGEEYWEAISEFLKKLL